MQLSINGQIRSFDDEITISDLLRELQVSMPRVAVELNRDVIPRAQHASTKLADGDELEVVTLVGGG